MYHIKDDQRAIYSAELLYDGLVKLMREMPFDSIKVTELVVASQVGRTTFYRHFDTIEDILRWRSDQTYDEMIQYVIAYVQKHGNPARVMLLKPVLEYFYLNSEIIELLIQVNRLDIAMASLNRAVTPHITPSLTYLANDEAYLDYDMTIRIAIVTNILVKWIATGKQQSPDELADTLSRRIKNMITLDQLI
ncbi:MAG: TetR/AcrR family transcriptional regulator [Phototrophicaceae bacterium]